MIKIYLDIVKISYQSHTPHLQEPDAEYLQKIAILSDNEFSKFYGKEPLNHWKHISKTEGTCTFNEAVRDIRKLRELHKQMDEAVLEAYGWHIDTDKWGPAIDLAHDFYEVDYLPENDRIRFTISPEARKEVLKRPPPQPRNPHPGSRRRPPQKKENKINQKESEEEREQKPI